MSRFVRVLRQEAIASQSCAHCTVQEGTETVLSASVARASAASRYALGACSASMAWVLRARAPAASLITASCSALGAEGAARLCTLQRGQPMAWALRARAPAAA